MSDRESVSITPGEHDANLKYAQDLVAQNKGNEMMPRSSFWAPITASRYNSLFSVSGDDDFFSSDLGVDGLSKRLGHVGAVGEKSGLKILVAYSNEDEYVPSSVDKEMLLKQLVLAMNGSDLADNADETSAVARGLMLEHGNHNLSRGDHDMEIFVEKVGQLLKQVGSN